MNDKPARPPRRRRAALARHRRLCTICDHPDREAIEEAFLRWDGPFQIQREFQIESRSSLYRHAHALGLFERRNRNTRFALGTLIERAASVEPTAGDIIRAVRVFTQIDANGEWIDRPRRIVHTSTRAASNERPLPGTRGK